MASPRFMLDTNICIFLRRQKSASVTARFAALQPGEAAMSIITYGEQLYGAEKSQDRAKAIALIQRIAGMIPVLPIAVGVADFYGKIRSDLEAKGLTIGNNDLWIAAHALHENLILVTNNRREFDRVGMGLQVEDWTQP